MAERAQRKKLPHGGSLKGMSVKCFDLSFSVSFSSPLTQKIRSLLSCDWYGLTSSSLTENFLASLPCRLLPSPLASGDTGTIWQ